MVNLTEQAHIFLGNCPRQIKRHLERVFETLFETISTKDIKSVLLIGSAARDELSFSLDNENPDIFSDYEYLVITRNKLTFDIIHKLKQNNLKLQREFAIKSPLFSIDFGIAHHGKWKLTPPTLWAFEVRQSSVLIYGEDARNDLREITISNLDFGNLNQLVLVRLWNMLAHLPQSCILGTETDYERFTAKLCYARNILDILTIYMPNMGVLKAGYKNRFDAFNSLEDSIFDSDEIRIIKQAHSLKLGHNDQVSYSQLRESFFVGFIKLLSFLAKTKTWDMSPETLPDFVRNIEYSRIFDDAFIKKTIRRYLEFKIFFRQFIYPHPLRGIKWLITENRYCLLGLLLSLHAITFPNSDKKRKEKFIDFALYSLEELTLKSVHIRRTCPLESLLEIREDLLDFMMDWFYSRRLISKEEILHTMRYSENDT